MSVVLLVQVRAMGDRMAGHERECVARRLGSDVTLRSYNVFDHHPERSWLDGIDALIIGGSGAFSVHDERSEGFVFPLRDLLDRCLEIGMPGFGICFGHQLLGMHLGAQVVTDESRKESGTVGYQLTEAGKADPLFGAYGDRFHGHTGHTDRVTRVPNGTVLIAENDTVQPQVLKVRGAAFYSTQFHPDLIAEEAQDRYRAFASGLGPEALAHVQADIDSFDTDKRDTETLLRRFLKLYRVQ